MKIDKTEREAREEFYRRYNVASHHDRIRAQILGPSFDGLSHSASVAARAFVASQAAQQDPSAPIWAAVKAALGLEFEPEGAADNGLLPCPACGGPATHVACKDPFARCNRRGCLVTGPSNDPDGAKWNAMPRQGQAGAGRALRAAAWGLAKEVGRVHESCGASMEPRLERALNDLVAALGEG